MRSNYDPERVLAVTCPACGAKAGEACLTSSGQRKGKHDYHANRKGIVYPEFARARRGFSDPTKKANKAMDALDAYLDVRMGQHDCRTPGEHDEMAAKVAKVRDELFAALKDGFTHGK